MPQVISPAPAIQPFGSWARREQWGIVLVLAVFGILAFAYSIVIPLGKAADKVSHYAYVQYLAVNKSMPKPEGAVLGESHQPPLYYALAALRTGWIPQENLVVLANPDFVLYDPQTPNLLLHPRSEGFPFQGVPLAWHLTRVFSIGLGAVTVWAAWQAARVVAPHNLALAFGVASFVAFLPSFLSLAAVVNNDNLIIALAARRGLLDEATRRIAVLAGILVLLFSIAYFRWALYDLGAGQARQLLPTLVPLEVETNELAAGKEIPVALTWQAISAPSENYWLSLQLVQGDEGIASKDGVPSAGRRTTDWWEPGQIYSSRHLLKVPENAAPGNYALMLGIHPMGRWEWLPIQGQAMVRLSNIHVTAPAP